jgi:hypothetical protein
VQIRPNRYHPIRSSHVSALDLKHIQIRISDLIFHGILFKSYLMFCRSKNSKLYLVGILETSRIQ